jgi:8-oxo-dGTP pyrophosphatase MutT (NUDIX family)
MARRDWSASAFIGGATAFVVVRKQHKDGSWSQWHLPNGKKEPHDEHSVHTVIRETYEETGLRIRPHQIRKIAWEKRKVRRRIGKRFRIRRYTQVLYVVVGHEKPRLPLKPREHDHEARLMDFQEYETTSDFKDADRTLIDQYRLVRQTIYRCA